jgi:hypothetical protein
MGSLIRGTAAELRVVALVILTLSSTACAQAHMPPPQRRVAESLVPAPVPHYDANAHCQRLGEAAGGSALVELTCREQEASARTWLLAHMTTRHIRSYCQNLGTAADGSLNVIRMCVDQEEKATAQLDRER